MTGLLQAATTFGATDVAAYCLRQGVEVHSMVLMHVIRSKKSEPVYRLFVESGAVEVDYYVDRTGTILGAAANNGKHSLATFLLSKGADVNSLYEAQGSIPILACAAMYSDTAMVNLLLEYGAKIKGSGALALAAKEGNLENVQALLGHGADVNEMEPPSPFYHQGGPSEAPPLHKAAENHHIEVVKALLKAGADINSKDARGRTAAETAKGAGDDSILRELVEAAAR